MARKLPKPELNLADAYDWIAELVNRRESVRDGMQYLAGKCNESLPHRLWRELVDYDLETDVRELGKWLNRVLVKEPPVPEISVLWFGLFNPVVRGRATCGLYVSGARNFYTDEGAGDWDWTGRYWPNGRYAQSDYLRHMYTVAHSPNGPGNDAEYAMALGYASLALIALARGACARSLLGGARERMLAVGFDSGDSLFLATITGDGLQPFDGAKHLKPKPPIDHATALYEVVQPRKGRWWLDSVLSADGDWLPGGFGETGAPEKATSLSADIRDKGERADFNHPVMGPPVVRRSLAAAIEAIAPGTIQRIPISIAGDGEPWEVLNVISTVSWKQLLKSVPDGSPKPWRSAYAVQIARVLPYPGPIAVSAAIKRELEAREVTGLLLEPLGQSNPWRYLGLPTRR